ncbi:MAG: hypothetical protein HeimC3_39540 [Candidatus Heimdallarchaeota archaeon LC_3]|nr:MAG: hypothetical protein HeimC3_39540 [Candidatus Heimdallarchaeota archaeon LC_3]
MGNFELWKIESYELLKKWNFEPSKYNESSIPILTVYSYPELVKLFGIIKSHFSKRNLKILLRGQQNDYNHQTSSIFRCDLTRNFKPIIKELRESLIKSIYYLKESKGLNILNILAIEPILQHYGIPTPWIDLVDDLPHAIWFSLYKQNVKEFPEIKSILESQDLFKNPKKRDIKPHLYIYGLKTPNTLINGLYEGDEQLLINLRESFEPLAIRPHFQNAYLMTQKNDIDYLDSDKHDPEYESDYNKYVLTVIKIDKSAFEITLSPNGIFNQSNVFPEEDSDTIFYKLREIELVSNYLVTHIDFEKLINRFSEIDQQTLFNKKLNIENGRLINEFDNNEIKVILKYFLYFKFLDLDFKTVFKGVNEIFNNLWNELKQIDKFTEFY